MQNEPVYRNPYVAAEAPADARAAFIRRTYGHLAVALAAFAALEAALLQWSGAEALAARMTEGMNWLLVLGVFMVATWIADRWARSEVSSGIQYLGLALMVAAYAILFLPLLYIATNYVGPDVIVNAALLTGALFFGLTAVVVTTRKNFSFLRGILAVIALLALGLIVASILFGFSLGLWFSFAMVGLAAGMILYTTSNILFEYRTDQHVAASLALFAAVAMLFFYILRILIALRR